MITDPALRIPAVAANLLPVEIVEARRSRKIRRFVTSGLVAVVVLLAGWFVFAAYQTSVARDDLANAQAEAEVLVRQQHGYADVVNTQAQSHAIEGQLSALFAGDLDWATVVGEVQGAAPGGVTVSGVSGLTGADKATGATAPGGTSDTPVDPNPVGSITITGTGPSKAAVAAYVDALSAVPGLANAYLTTATEQGKTVQFTIRVEIVRAALGSRFAPKSGK